MKKFRWDKHYLYWGITAFCVIVCSIVFFSALSNWSYLASVLSKFLHVLSPIIYGFIIAYILSPIVKFFEKKIFSDAGKKLFPKSGRKAALAVRVFSLSASVVLMFLIIILLLIILLPQLYASLEKLISKTGYYASTIVSFVENSLENNPDLEEAAVTSLDRVYSYFINWLQNSILPQVDTIISSVSTGVVGVLKGFVNFLIGVVVSVYVLYNREMFAAQSKKVLYSILNAKYVKTIMDGLSCVNRAFGEFFIGKILDSAIIGVICLICLSLMNMPYAALISVIIGITNIIPFFGPFIGAIPSAFLILLEDPIKCLIFVVFIIILQQVDGNIIGPKIISNTTGLTGFWVMFAIIVAGGMFGFVGMLCGVPVAAVLYAALKNFCARQLKKHGLPVETPEYMQIDYIDPETNEPVYK